MINYRCDKCKGDSAVVPNAYSSNLPRGWQDIDVSITTTTAKQRHCHFHLCPECKLGVVIPAEDLKDRVYGLLKQIVDEAAGEAVGEAVAEALDEQDD